MQTVCTGFLPSLTHAERHRGPHTAQDALATSARQVGGRGLFKNWMARNSAPITGDTLAVASSATATLLNSRAANCNRPLRLTPTMCVYNRIRPRFAADVLLPRKNQWLYRLRILPLICAILPGAAFWPSGPSLASPQNAQRACNPTFVLEPRPRRPTFDPAHS